MNRRTKMLTIAVLIILVLGVPVSILALWVATTFGSNAGSPELAKEWRHQLKQYKSLAEAKAADPTLEAITLANGEWLFGHAQDSHGIWRRGGGTMVMKDSNHETHAFLGAHVCGPNYIGRVSGGDRTQDLGSFYKEMIVLGFHEYKFDKQP